MVRKLTAPDLYDESCSKDSHAIQHLLQQRFCVDVIVFSFSFWDNEIPPLDRAITNDENRPHSWLWNFTSSLKHLMWWLRCACAFTYIHTWRCATNTICRAALVVRAFSAFSWKSHWYLSELFFWGGLRQSVEGKERWLSRWEEFLYACEQKMLRWMHSGIGRFVSILPSCEARLLQTALRCILHGSLSLQPCRILHPYLSLSQFGLGPEPEGLWTLFGQPGGDSYKYRWGWWPLWYPYPVRQYRPANGRCHASIGTSLRCTNYCRELLISISTWLRFLLRLCHKSLAACSLFSILQAPASTFHNSTRYSLIMLVFFRSSKAASLVRRVITFSVAFPSSLHWPRNIPTFRRSFQTSPRDCSRLTRCYGLDSFNFCFM